MVEESANSDTLRMKGQLCHICNEAISHWVIKILVKPLGKKNSDTVNLIFFWKPIANRIASKEIYT